MPYVTWENFEDALYQRKKDVRNWWGWDIPNCVFECVLELLKETDGLPNSELNTPSYIVDNIAVNGSWSYFDELDSEHYPEYRGLSGIDFINALYEKGGAISVFPDEQIVLWNTGL